MKLINRTLEHTITRLLEHFPVVGILGSRQVGKTTLAKEVIRKSERDFLYLDLERPGDIGKLNNAEFYLRQNENTCIVLDEVQRKPELFSLLRSLVDEKRKPGRFLLLGAASPGIVKDASESLAGRIAYKELRGLNLLEVSPETNGEMIKHWIRGGYPNAFLEDERFIRKTWHRNFIRTYTERDLPALGLRTESTVMRNFLMMISHLHGEFGNYGNLSDSLGLSRPTVQKYINFFSESFIIRILPPYAINIKKRLVKSPRIYFNDTGLLHSLLDIDDFDALQGHPKLGKSWEGYVIEQIYQILEDHFEFYFYRTHHGAEIDLVLAKGGRPKVSIEIKYSGASSISKGFYVAIKDLGTENNFVITAGANDYQMTHGLRVCDLYTFLKKYTPKLVN